LVEASHHPGTGQTAREEVLEERQLPGVTIAAAIAQITLPAQYPVANQRLIVLGRVVELVVLQIAARRGDLEGQLLEGAVGWQLTAVQRAADPVGREAEVVELGAVAVDEAGVASGPQQIRGQIRDQPYLGVLDRTIEGVQVQRTDDVLGDVLPRRRQPRAGLYLLHAQATGAELGVGKAQVEADLLDLADRIGKVQDRKSRR